MGLICDDEPKCYRDAQGVVEWEAAMNEEIEALHKNGMWDLVPKRKDVEIITCKWVYKLNKKADWSIHRYKGQFIDIRLAWLLEDFLNNMEWTMRKPSVRLPRW